MTTIRPVIREDLDALFSLNVGPDQQDYVAPNAITLAEFAYVSGGYVFTIEHTGHIVGLMGLIDFQEHDELEIDDDPKASFLMRMMVDKNHQRKGIGKAAMTQALDWAKARGSTCFQTSVVPGNDAAARFYESLGLRTTGRIVEDEIEMSRDL